MFGRTSLVALFLASSSPIAASRADDGPRKVENVVIVTLDGFRHQEVFGGAEEALIDGKAGGVEDAAGLERLYRRDTPEARREALLPFLWKTVAAKGQIFGDR